MAGKARQKQQGSNHRMRRIPPAAFAQLGAAALLALLANVARAQSPKPAETEKEPIAIVELGAATSWDTHGGAAQFAPSLAVEATPIEGQLELEAGTSAFVTRSSTEWDTDLLFKRPWTLSHSAEFMIGVGPEWVHLSRNGASTNSVELEVAGDFMFWPVEKHRFGWFLEPAFDRSFGSRPTSSIGLSAGLLISIP